METKPLIVIVGPTASGKTALAIDLAERFGGEIICADSRTVYKGMDIGTAKPSHQERARVPHWGLDLVAPYERYTAADFKKYALQKIKEIRKRGHIPFLVGGTGLYIDSVIFDYQFGAKANEKLRQKLQHMSLDELHKYCVKNNIDLPENNKNQRYIIRAIEQKGVNRIRKNEPISDSIIVGITIDRLELKNRINQRADEMIKNGVIREAESLAQAYGWESEAMTGNIYPLCRQYLARELSIEDLQDKFVTLDWRLAKRQLTWLRRNEHITWLPLDEANQYLASHLASHREA